MNKILQLTLFVCLCLHTTNMLARDISFSMVNETNDKKEEKTEPVKDSLYTDVTTVDNKQISKKYQAKVLRDFKSLNQFDIPVNPSKKTFGLLETKEGFQFNGINATQDKKWLEMAQNVFKTIDETENYIKELTSEDLSELPVAIKPKTISNVTYTVGIAKAVFKPSFTELTVFLKVEFPESTSPSNDTTTTKEENNVLILGASNIKLSHEGGIIGAAKLNLISQFTTNINSGAILLTLNGGFNEPGTYATIDCFGFKEFGIDANIKFTNGLVFPVDKDGKKKTGYVESDFKIVASDWNDMVVNITLPEFGITGLEGTTFRPGEAVFDFSDLRNDEATPTAYLDKHYSERTNLWRGVYINTLEVVLPKAFEKKNDDKRIAFGATDLIIDAQGVTGKFTGDNIFTLEEGTASGWDFSLDHFLLDIEVNKLKAGEFAGEIVLPVSKVDKVKYSAIIQPDEYSLTVESTKDISFDVWNANVTLTKDSYIEMKVKDDKFRPKANLNGSVSIVSGLGKEQNASPDVQKSTVDFKGIVFEEMVLQTESPKFSVGYFGYQGDMKLADFPITVNEIGLKTPSGNQADLVFDFSINLTSETDGGNGGGAKLAIKSVLDETEGRDHWKYDGIDLEKIALQMDITGLELKGALMIFEDDATYGTGFAGTVGAKLTAGMSLEVEAKALFGRTPDFRYWFVDASTTLPQGIPIYPGFALNKFGGGFHNRMKMAGMTNDANAAYSQVGASLSGVVYEPSKESGFGMKASVGITTQNSEELFHATLELGMVFLKSGGLQDVYFKGHGEMLTGLPTDFYDQIEDQLGYLADGADIPKPSSDASMSADVFIRYDFVNDVFHANSEVYVNFGPLKGRGPNGRAGWMDFYAGQGQWHILVGTPTDPLGVTIDIGGVNVNSKSYFMTGDNIPGSPSPPDIVANILGTDTSKLEYARDLNMLDSGKGLAFGADWSMSTGDLRFLIFYAKFNAGIGFDIMLKDYGEAQCKGSSEQIGLNGWYANGQSYAYLQGDVGMRFKLFGKKKKITIFSGGGALLMQTKLPNPSWLSGHLGGSYNVLGGLIKGRFNFKVELGEKCEIINEGALEGITVIGDMSPKEGTTDVDVFVAPQVPFNLQINKVFELRSGTEDRKYRILMDKFEVTKNGQPIAGKIEWNTNNDIATFYSHEILPPNTSLKAYVQVHFEEYVGGKWETIKDQGKITTESKEVNFTTGTAPESIPLSNIAFMYPMVNQKNFFTKEYNKGYINLKRGQSYLFDGTNDWGKTMTMSTNTGISLDTSFGYNTANKQVTFNIPEGIATQTNYNVKIKLVPQEDNGSDNVTESYTTQKIGGDESGNEVEIKSRAAEEVVIKGEERALLAFDFSTSQYTTFDKKIRAMKGNKDLYKHVTYPYGLTLLTAIDPLEPFDLAELAGNKYSGNKPLIVARAIMDNSYYQNEIYPLLYQNYPIGGTISVSRDTDKISVPPVEGVEPMSWYLTYLENGYTGETSLYNPYRYNLAQYFYQDYEDLRYQLVSSNLLWETMPQYRKLIIESFPVIRKGKYKTKLRYVLPGQVTNGGDQTIKFTNPIYE
ncbi:hypothetical protein [Aquimarina sediminis]|uniref:hypothetical protein n=1 Tax=Aquimarina sediminis TaxID=2070536 RepID=UPI000FFE93E8|nr:hypothetical protein [Aquimarina sediminis]